MVKTLKFVFAIFLLLIINFNLPVYAACDAAELAKPAHLRSADCPAGLEQVEFMISNIISVIVGLGFVALLVMLVMAGIKYLTSGGEPKAIQSAHYTVSWAMLGIFFLALAWVILQLIGSVTGINVTVFDIKTLCGDSSAPIPFPFCSPSPAP